MKSFLERVKDISPVIIIGMHRSGTSMLTRNLSALGVSVGKDVSGNAESRYFQKLNRDIMADAGGRWDNVKPIIEKMRSPEFINENAEKIESKLFWDGELAGFFELDHRFSVWLGLKKCVWGWKDPRNSVTLPIWLKVFPHAKVIHVIRNGIDVAISLYRRENKRRDTDPDLGQGCRDAKFCLDLWEDYLEAGREHLKSYSTIKQLELRYEELLESPGIQLKYVLKFLDVNFSQKKLDKVINAINPERLDNSEYREEIKDIIPQMQANRLMKELGYT